MEYHFKAFGAMPPGRQKICLADGTVQPFSILDGKRIKKIRQRGFYLHIEIDDEPEKTAVKKAKV